MDPYEFLVRILPDGQLSGCHRRDYLPSGIPGPAVEITVPELLEAVGAYRPLVLDPVPVCEEVDQ